MALPAIGLEAVPVGDIRSLGASLRQGLRGRSAAGAGAPTAADKSDGASDIRERLQSALSGAPVLRTELEAMLGEPAVGVLLACGLVRELADRRIVAVFAARFLPDLVIFTDLPRRDFLHETHFIDPLWEAPALMRMLVRRPARLGLDLGCGSGALALSMAAHCERVLGSDVNPRALQMARLNAVLNDVQNVEFLHSDLFDQFASGQQFDHIVFNAPLGPSFREGHMLEAGEGLFRRFMESIPQRLSAEGLMQANVCGKDWGADRFLERIMGWLGPEGPDFQYLLLELWRREGGARHFLHRLGGTLRTGKNCFRCTAVRRGWLTLRRRPGASSHVAPTNYHMWVHQLPDRAAERMILALMDAAAGGR